MSNYRRARHGQTYFFTLVTNRRKPILCLDASRLALRQSILQTREQLTFTIDAWALLPDHLHCIWTLPSGDTDYSKRWGMIKAGFSKRMKHQLDTTALRPSQRKQRETGLWQRRFWEHCITNDTDYRRHCDYIHFNPVKHGLVNAACDWPYSTFERFRNDGVYSESWGSSDLSVGLPDTYGE